MVATRPRLNQAFYGAKVDPTNILIRHRVNNTQAERLIAVVAKGTKKR